MESQGPQLKPAFVTEPFDSEAFSVRFSPDDIFLAASGSHGTVSVFNVSTGKEAYRLNRSGSHTVRQVCWRPEQESDSLRTRGLLLGASTDGLLRQWHVTSGRCLEEFGPGEKTDQLLCVDYSHDGRRIAAGGLQDIFVFDEETKKQMGHLQGGDYQTTAGHSNRVLAVRFQQTPDEPWALVSGGWDNTVQFWDLRVGHAVRAIFGPHICGDALDLSSDGKRLLTGSWRDKEPLEIWDVGQGERIEALPWRKSGSEDPACFLYAARFSKDAQSSMIAAGGSFSSDGGGEAKIFRQGAEDSKCIATMVRYTCLSADFSSPAAGLLALGGLDGRVRMMRLAAPSAGETPEGC
eukprot:TRINITY_DN92803_c0_g1_i1.p1 TRINITY_DN92803_c0_g1~~TRINITY_DN92803_c0_g1_i1.p1  ORF type:complete len:361 (+),score=63.88 TRINITY_DN92803_c0_g1_i1:35-1084(+)